MNACRQTLNFDLKLQDMKKKNFAIPLLFQIEEEKFS